MCQRFIENREKFVDLVFSLGSFDVSRIIREFKKKQHGDTALDGGQSIPEFLEELRERGVLRYSNGKYSVTDDPYAAPLAAIQAPSELVH